MGTAVHSEALLKELHNLWTSLGSQAEEGKSSGVLRACAMTLIVATEESDDAAAIGETLAELMREHPSRAIVLRLRPAGRPLLEARVFAQCWLPLGQRRQICSEQIEITSSHASLPDVPAVVLALTVPDLPVVLWCRCASLFQDPGFQAISRLADKMIVDSSRSPEPRMMLRQLTEAVQSGRIVADLSWVRLSRWREMIALAFETPECRGRRQEFSGISVSYAGDAVPVTAYYMAGWLASRLGWPAGDSRLSLAAADGGVSGLQSVVLTSPGMEVSIRRRGEHEVDVRVNELVQPTILPPDADSAVLGEELSISGRDPMFEAAVAAAVRIAQSARS